MQLITTKSMATFSSFGMFIRNSRILQSQVLRIQHLFVTRKRLCMIHWGIVGPGVIANAFAKGMFGCKDANLLAVASSDQLRAETFARQYNVPHWFSSYEQLFSLKEIDVVYIANLNPQHEATIRQALLHDKHVLCEKPLTLNSEQSRELFSIAEKRGLFLMEAYWTACLPTYRKAKQWIERGLIGQLK